MTDVMVHPERSEESNGTFVAFAGARSCWILRSAQNDHGRKVPYSGQKNKKDEAPKELRPAKTVSLKRGA
jgi:hypothetical protein